MNLSRRHLLLLSTLALSTLALKPAAAQDSTGPRRLLLDASRALQGGNAARFIGYFDKQHYAERPALRRTIMALLEARTVASSIDIISLPELRHETKSRPWKAEREQPIRDLCRPGSPLTEKPICARMRQFCRSISTPPAVPSRAIAAPSVVRMAVFNNTIS